MAASPSLSLCVCASACTAPANRAEPCPYYRLDFADCFAKMKFRSDVSRVMRSFFLLTFGPWFLDFNHMPPRCRLAGWLAGSGAIRATSATRSGSCDRPRVPAKRFARDAPRFRSCGRKVDLIIWESDRTVYSATLRDATCACPAFLHRVLVVESDHPRVFPSGLRRVSRKSSNVSAGRVLGERSAQFPWRGFPRASLLLPLAPIKPSEYFAPFVSRDYAPLFPHVSSIGLFFSELESSWPYERPARFFHGSSCLDLCEDASLTLAFTMIISHSLTRANRHAM